MTQWNDTDGDGFGDNPIGTNGDQCPDVAGVSLGDDGRGCPILDLDSDGVLNENDLCPETPLGTLVGSDGCELPDEPDEPSDNTTDPTDPVDPVDPVDPTDPGDDTNSGDDTTDSTDESESESGLFGMSYTLIGIIGVVVVLLLITAFFVRGRAVSYTHLTLPTKRIV